jgi:NADH:ubiquinone oxidoreductase subunit 5 (subunit L)/multisubunit Na+/H+ antiporter MnhA subunit
LPAWLLRECLLLPVSLAKEEILLESFQSNKAVYVIALFTAALTAFYMFRLYFSISGEKNPASRNHIMPTVLCP